jgi:hypothetical protein
MTDDQPLLTTRMLGETENALAAAYRVHSVIIDRAHQLLARRG